MTTRIWVSWARSMATVRNERNGEILVVFDDERLTSPSWITKPARS